MASRGVFLDRDGVLNRERIDYVKTPEELELLSGIEEPLRKIHEKDFLVVVVTNQSAVGRGLTTVQTLEGIHEKMRNELEIRGCSIDAIYYCPHIPEDSCSCRKPQPGLILRAAQDLGIDLKRSWLIGDKSTDLEAAERAGCRGIMVPSNDDGLKIGVREIMKIEEQSSGGPS